ncbi:uncharacterized protein LOC143213259 [Lasioglossum baleicum]|uniref:uncharacterized protein LOC143213259 n=1 Tax=Lasioglossum baleicum TaxID=434251 RepID=UPI003FCCE0D7
MYLVKTRAYAVKKKNMDADTIILNNEADGKEESSLSIVEDTLEIRNKGLKKFAEADDTKCYRCKHFLSIPQNFLEGRETTSNFTEEHEADLRFIQAVVWLKATTRVVKDISLEQMRVLFQKQWNNILQKKNDSGVCNKDVSATFSEDEEHANKCLASILSLTLTQKDDRISDNRLECAKKCGTTQFQRHTNQDDDFTKNISNLSIFCSESTQSCFQSFAEDTVIQEKRIIPESLSECSSCSDMFKDSAESEEANDNTSQKEMDDELYDNNKSIHSTHSPSQGEMPCCNNSSQGRIPESKIVLSGNLNENASADMFNESCSLDNKSVNGSRNGEDRTLSGLTIPGITQISIPDLQKPNSPKADSTYNTYQSNGEYCISQNEDKSDFLNLKIGSFTSYHRCSFVDDLQFPTVNMNDIEWSPDENQEPCLSPVEPNNERNNSARIIQNTVRDISPFRPNRRRSQAGNLIEDGELMGSREKRRKLDFGNEMDTLQRNEGKPVSSKWLRFTLDAMNADDIAFESMKVILSALQDEKLARQYMRDRCWKNTMEMQAVNAVLNFCDVFETENNSKACTNEVVQAVTSTLNRCIGNTELNKVTVLLHQVTIVLELCASMGVCIEVINYLTTKLKSYESILISLMEGKKADVHNIVTQLHLIFYSLSICLEKYRSVFSDENGKHFEEDNMPPVIDLWKKQFVFDSVLVEESIQTRERRWRLILNDFTIITAESFIQFTEMSRRLSNILTCR